MNKKIAFCFLIYDTIEYEELWFEFFKNIDPSKYTIYIHYKNQYKLKYFNDFVLNKCIPTAWGKISLVHASNILFDTAYNDNENYKFILLCGTTLPLKNFDYIYEKMIKNNYGYMNYLNSNTLCHQWIIFNREIVSKIIDYGSDGFIKMNDRIHGCPDEKLYFLFIKENKLEKNIIFKNDICNELTMFVNWGNKEYQFNDGKLESYPKNYKSITLQEINYLLNSKCLFGRKFFKDCIISNSDIKLLDYLINNINTYNYDNIIDDIYIENNNQNIKKEEKEIKTTINKNIKYTKKILLNIKKK